MPETSKTPDLTPNRLPTALDIENDVVIAQIWLAQVAQTPDDPRCAKAEQLFAQTSRNGPTRFEELASLALRTATAPLTVPLAEIEAAYDDLWTLIFDFSEDAGTYRSPLHFNRPTDLMNVIEMTTVWYRIATEEVTSSSTRALARLARVDTEVMEAQMMRDDIPFQNYGISLREMEEMTVSERLFWYDQEFAFKLHDVVGWLQKFPGFTAPAPIEPVVSVG